MATLSKETKTKSQPQSQGRIHAKVERTKTLPEGSDAADEQNDERTLEQDYPNIGEMMSYPIERSLP